MGQVEYPRWLQLLKIAKSTSTEPLGIFGLILALDIGIQNEKKSVVEFCHCDLLSVYKYDFA